MKTKQNVSEWLTKAIWVLAGLMIGALGVPQSQATLSPAYNDHSVVFADDFNNNNAGWNLTGGSGSTIGLDPNASGTTAWYATTPDSSQAYATLNLPTPIDSTKGEIDIYMRVRVDDVNNGGLNRFDFLLGRFGLGNDGQYVDYAVWPGSQEVLTWHGTANGVVGYTAYTPPDTTTYVNYLLTMVDQHDGTTLLSTYINDSGTYVLTGILPVPVTSGIFDFLQIDQVNVNGVPGNNRVYFDSIMITQGVPEPSIGLLLLTGFGLWRGKRAVKDRNRQNVR